MARSEEQPPPSEEPKSVISSAESRAHPRSHPFGRGRGAGAPPAQAGGRTGASSAIRKRPTFGSNGPIPRSLALLAGASLGASEPIVTGPAGMAQEAGRRSRSSPAGNGLRAAGRGKEAAEPSHS